MNTITRIKEALPSCRSGKGTTEFIRLCGFNDLVHQTLQHYKALVDMGAQCTLMPSDYKGSESICTSGLTGGSQHITVLEAEVSLTENEW